MEFSEAGTSTNNPSADEYQVFLSFRGSDTRRGFTNSLYHALIDAGIHVFIDDEELRPGEVISGDLLRAIDDSKFYIPIFSKNYGSSHWCLRELAKMVQNISISKEDGKKKVILPIFYDVKPDDVKLKTPLYNKAVSDLEQRMEDHKNKFISEDLEMWRKALQEVDGTKGWELEKYSGHGELIKTVVDEVVVRLKTRQRKVTEDLVGMEDRIAAINNLLDIDSGGVRLIGIYGMGGIGKTTLAKIIFNQLCPYFGKNCSFIDDVRETAKTKGLVKLQKQLLSDISHSRVAPNIDNIDHGINMIGETIRNKKMLIVLDDVDEGSQIQNLIGVDSLYQGTRVLVTTRDKSVLNIRGFKYKFEDYEMEGLSIEDALKLFSRHAFDNDHPPAKYYTLSGGFVSTTNGLPLALEAIGSSLFGQENKKIWEERLEKLKKRPHKDVLGKLRISYDVLEPDQQEIFLDVACFFIGEYKTNPMYMWSCCGLSPEDAIDILIKRCMIKVDKYDIFRMHDQFRDLGRAIAKQERTRLWDSDDVICELQSTEIKGSVKAIRLQWGGLRPLSVTLEQINRFPHIRLLSLGNGMYEGNLTDYPSNLLRIINHQCLEASNMMHLENLVELELHYLKITKDGVVRLIKGARKLKILILKCIRSIRRTPTFPEDSVLEKLTIADSGSFKEIDCSIDRLRCLTHLTIDGCSAIRKLPKQIGELKNLRHLSLYGCSKLTELPDSVSRLVSLTKLDVSYTKIRRLPNFNGKLPNLSQINALGAPIAEIPSTMSKFLHLQTLNLDNHQIQELPELPKSLTTLRLRSSALLTVPNLSNLTNLVDLLLSDGSDIRDRSMAIQNCDFQWIGRLSNLRKLYLCFQNVCAPTTELGSVPLLKQLNLHGGDLPTFEQLPSTLVNLILVHTQVKKGILDRICQLNKMDDKRMWEVSRTDKAIGSSLRRLKEAKLYRRDKPLKVQLLDALRLWERSRTQHRKCSQKLLCWSEETGSNDLQSPELTDRWRGAILVPSSLKMLQLLHLEGFPEVQDIQFVATLESLEGFTVGKCTSLKRLSGLSNLKNLKQLSIELCESLQVVEGIDELECLQELSFRACISMESIFHASGSKIPNECETLITFSGELPNSGFLSSPDGVTWPCTILWKSYREKILNGTKQAPESETETRDLSQETEDTEKKREKKTGSAKQQGKRKRRKFRIKSLRNIFQKYYFYCLHHQNN